MVASLVRLWRLAITLFVTAWCFGLGLCGHLAAGRSTPNDLAIAPPDAGFVTVNATAGSSLWGNFYFDFDILPLISPQTCLSLSYVPRYTRRVMCSTLCRGFVGGS